MVKCPDRKNNKNKKKEKKGKKTLHVALCILEISAECPDMLSRIVQTHLAHS